MAGRTIQIRLKATEQWMKETIRALIDGGDDRYRNRSESDVAKLMLEGPLKKEATNMKKKKAAPLAKGSNAKTRKGS